eukprot:14382735-Heterocapsa_arctica.AAC.1
MLIGRSHRMQQQLAGGSRGHHLHRMEALRLNQKARMLRRNPRSRRRSWWPPSKASRSWEKA